MNISDELTIVIPAKNEEILLPRLLMSLAEQDYPLMPNTRVILADADSTDRPIPLAMKFTNSLALTVIHGGLPSVGRNRGAIYAELPDPTLIRRAVEWMKRKSLHCVTTDIYCSGGIWLDHLLYACNNLVQRLSRFHKPFATGMFMLLDKEEFDRIGGFDEKALFAEDYQLTRQIERDRFRVIRGGIYGTNRRFVKMGHWAIVRLFLSTAIHGRKPNYYRNKYYEAYWGAY
jgi:glycosyltransferase involved in cell wall biosynthesis